MSQPPCPLAIITPNKWCTHIPRLLWQYQIITYLSVPVLSVSRCVSRFFDNHWQARLNERIVRVPEDFPSISRALHIGEILNELVGYSKQDPLTMVLSKGTHIVEIFSDNDREKCNVLQIRFSVTIVGSGVRVSNKNCYRCVGFECHCLMPLHVCKQHQTLTYLSLLFFLPLLKKYIYLVFYYV